VENCEGHGSIAFALAYRGGGISGGWDGIGEMAQCIKICI
jgi:hypothetical protein